MRPAEVALRQPAGAKAILEQNTPVEKWSLAREA